MGEDTIFVLVEDDAEARRTTCYRYTLAAHVLLLGGPERTERHVRGLDSGGHLGEGPQAIVLDPARRRLVYYLEPLYLTTDETIGPRPQGLEALEFFRVLRHVLPVVWGGWQVTWAWQADLDLVRYLGHATRRPFGVSQSLYVRRPQPLNAKTCNDGTLVTLREHGRLRAWVTKDEPHVVIRHGPELADLVAEGRADPAAWAKAHGVPIGGVHVDLDGRRVDWWTAGTTGGHALDQIHHWRWTGWEYHFHQDRFEDVAARCHPELPVPRPDWRRGLAVARHCAERWHNGDDGLVTRIALDELDALLQSGSSLN